MVFCCLKRNHNLSQNIATNHKSWTKIGPKLDEIKWSNFKRKVCLILRLWVVRQNLKIRGYHEILGRVVIWLKRRSAEGNNVLLEVVEEDGNRRLLKKCRIVCKLVNISTFSLY